MLKNLSARWRASFAAGMMICGVYVFSCAGFAQAASVPMNDFEQAMKIAKAQGKPVFLDFTAEWCGNCKVLDRKVLSNSVITERLNNFVSVKIDADTRSDLLDRFKVDGLPTLVQLSPAGHELSRQIGGNVSVRELSSKLDQSYMITASYRAAETPAVQVASNDVQNRRFAPAATETQNGQRHAVQESKSVPMLHAPDETRSGNRETLKSAEKSVEKSTEKLTEKKAADSTLQGSVYAMGNGKETGKSAKESKSSDSLKDLAEKTAGAQKSENGKEVASVKENSKAEAKPEVKTEAKVIASAENTTAKQVVEVVNKPEEKLVSRSSPLIETRIAALKPDELPKPLLNRTIETKVVQKIEEPAAARSTRPSSAIDSIKQARGESNIVAVSNGSKLVASQAPKATIRSAVKTETDSSDKIVNVSNEKAVEKETEKPVAEKTSKGASQEDIARWVKDADTKLVGGYKKEARAMYGKVVDNDPENKFQKSDVAFIKMVSLIVDKDDEALRQKAYKTIREFEARFPKSSHKDYYTLIRATLAADLGETNAAHALLEDYPTRFPNSRYKELAHKTWKDLPAVKKETASASKKSGSGSSSSKSGTSSAKSTSSKNSKSSTKK